jgi:TonB-linked SusC/RagA family outer membrane protein
MQKKMKSEKIMYYKLYLTVCLLFWGMVIKATPIYVESQNNNQQKNIKVNGTVTDVEGIPLIGVSVVVSKVSSIGTITDNNGGYSLTLPDENAEIQFSYIGFETQKVKAGNRTVINITLEEDLRMLEEVVVVGYGTQKKETLTGSVSVITTKDLLQSPQANISNALAGRMPGLLSAQRSGQPGDDASTIRIRGIGTFSGGQDPLVIVDGIESDNYNNIDANEVESLTILKDASATAVYGVRGANGVIIITTKRGLSGKPQLSFTQNVGRTNFPFLKENMNSLEYAIAFTQAEDFDSYITTNTQHRYSPEVIEAFRTKSDPIFYPDTDWYELMLKEASWQAQTNLNIRGGTDKVKYFTSLGYFTQDGMMDANIIDNGYDANYRYNRYNIRSNFDIDFTKNLSVSIDLSTQLGKTKGPNWSAGIMNILSTARSDAAPGIVDGKAVLTPLITTAGSFTPIAVYNKGWISTYENNLNASLRVNYKMDYLLKGLSLRGTLSYKNFNTEQRTFDVERVMYNIILDTNGEKIFTPQSDPKPVGGGVKTPIRTRRIYAEAGINYVKSFGIHNVTGLVLYNQSKYYDPDLMFLVPNGYQGIVGRVTYDYANKYLAEFNIGYNGTENFAEGKRFGTFPAYSLGWVLTNESFFPENNYLTFAKFRGSFGVVGNDKIGGSRFMYLPSTYTYSSADKPGYYLGEISSRQPFQTSSESKLGNPELTWEKAEKTNIGVDLKFWKDKIGFTADYFIENRNNILANRGTIPSIVGMDMPAANFGIMENKGYEGEISYYDAIGKFRYYIEANYTFAHNKVVYKDEVLRRYTYRNETGQRYGQFFGLVADGIYNTWEEVNDPNRPKYLWSNDKIQPGDIRYIDINGDGIIDEDDQIPIGYSNFPEKMFGITLGASFKGFDFSVLFQGATNVSNYPSKRTSRGFYADGGDNTSAVKDLLRSWSPERYEQGLEIVYPRYAIENGAHNYQSSTFWLEDASYLRLKNAEIGYSLQRKALKVLGIASLRMYVNGNNLLTWTRMKFPGQDPERPSGLDESTYPVTRVFNFGLNINF